MASPWIAFARGSFRPLNMSLAPLAAKARATAAPIPDVAPEINTDLSLKSITPISLSTGLDARPFAHRVSTRTRSG